MLSDIVCRPSAFKHNVTEADIRWAFTTAVYDLPDEDDEEKRLLMGKCMYSMQCLAGIFIFHY